ncbi:hypothetical protein [Variovorax sp. Sphag1AA]|uniref:hypothetical protein n=1 Tax=Variovorax sp. Sphag1AA TaxID=2587027 RepID=UPI001620B367|nr:hypothetical protein [Variovorax sp. Sphag1AA]MBB3178749.1 hypothetical protein [Variovorax sp. Sphag1AA]
MAKRLEERIFILFSSLQRICRFRDRRNIAAFDASGNYKSGPILSKSQGRILATMNSSGSIQSFSVLDQSGKVLCNGSGGVSNSLPNVNYCWATISAGTKYQVVAKGDGNQYLQFVVSTRAAGK